MGEESFSMLLHDRAVEQVCFPLLYWVSSISPLIYDFQPVL